MLRSRGDECAALPGGLLTWDRKTAPLCGAAELKEVRTSEVEWSVREEFGTAYRDPDC